MDIQTIEATPVLDRRRRLTVAQIGNEAAQAYAELRAEAHARGLAVNGPPIFAAHAMPQGAHTAFDIIFCLPVAATEAHHLPRLRCASLLYEGPLTDLFTRGYQPLLQAIAEVGLRPTGESREVYHAWHGPESAANRIEIQIGIGA